MIFARSVICSVATVALLVMMTASPISAQHLEGQRYDAAHRCGKTSGRWFTIRNAPMGDMPVRNWLRIDRTGRMRWNGRAITKTRLRKYALQVVRMNPVPGLELGLDDGLPCGLVAEARKIFSGVCSHATCIEYTKAEWHRRYGHDLKW
jgi:hypothetical protein